MIKQTKQTKPKITKVEKIIQKGRCQNILSSPMSSLSWRDLNIKGNLLKVHDVCPNPKCKCPKQNTFTLNQFHPEGPEFKITLKQN